jgi:hypothetical protein
MEKKYIYACIRLPMEIGADGKYTPFSDRAKLYFERCAELPPKSNISNHNLEDILDTLFPVEPKHTDHPIPDSTTNLVVYKHELQHSSRGISGQTTFKKHPKRSVRRYSIRQKNDIENTPGQL